MILNLTSPAMLAQAVSMRFNAGMARPVTPLNALAMEIPSTTGENIYPYLKEFGTIREWVGDRQIQNIAQGDFKIGNKPFEETHGIPRSAVEDDTYGLYGPMFEQTGQNVASFPSEQVFTTLKSGLTTLGPDGQFFFDTDHPVAAGVVSNHMGGSSEAWYIVDGSKVFKPVIWQPRKAFDLVRQFDPTDDTVFYKKQFVWGVDGRSGCGFSPFWQLAFVNRNAMDEAAVKATLTAMSVQRGDTGKPLGIMGTHLVCSPALAETARDILGREFLANGASNTMRGRLQLVVAPELL
jgi:phage major head subunit gpT-like protein